MLGFITSGLQTSGSGFQESYSSGQALVVTFYSFKGGVGRSMALANIAAWLYSQGRRVILVDWDLEAPGLESFFIKDANKVESIRKKPGLLDIMLGYKQAWDLYDKKAENGESHARIITRNISNMNNFLTPLMNTEDDAISTRAPGIWLLHAGCRYGVFERTYVKNVNSFNWAGFYDEYGGFEFFEWLRNELSKNVDFVFIDSRTGLTEMGGVCTQHLADVVMCLFAPNDANLMGARNISNSLLGNKIKELRGIGRSIKIIPIPSRVDDTGESDQLGKFKIDFEKEFKQFSDIDIVQSWDNKIKYVTKYSYREEILDWTSGEGHEDLRKAYSNIGRQLTRLLDERKNPVAVYRDKIILSSSHAYPADNEKTRSTINQLVDSANEKLRQNQFDIAKTLLESAVKLGGKDLPEHPDTINAMNTLAGMLYSQGDLSGARELHEKVLEVRLKILGSEHPDTLTSMNNLAGMLYSQGELTGAREFQEKALEVSERILGTEHPDTLTSMNNLSGTLYSQGDLSRARDLQEKVLEVRLKILGPEHTDTLTSMHNLAGMLYSQGDLPGARELQEKVLEARKRILGPEHPDTLISMNHLAETLKEQGDLPGAIELLEIVLEVRLKILGSEHPDTLAAMNNLAQTLKEQGDVSGARELQENALKVQERILGPEHPDIISSRINLNKSLVATKNKTQTAKIKKR